ncbi:MAG: hypothetical protein ACD_73C00317G0002 [uncultured bacterium]|nr:MAG: hypothetical protein ACD_73C00317G0002 [uncultured bacterium]
MQHIESTLIQSFILLNQFFRENNVRYCLIGGMAVGFWGNPRYTQDMDFTVATHEVSLKPVITLLEKGKFKLIKKGDSQIQITGHGNLRFMADIILAEVEYQDWVVQRAQVVEIFKTPVPICSAEDLIVLKLIANRRQDLLDIETILKTCALQLDKNYLKKWFEFWELNERFDNEFGKDFSLKL